MPVIVLNAPAGTLDSWNNIFGWTGLDRSDYYHLQVYDATTGEVIYSQWFNDSICTGLACAVSPDETLNLGNGDYKWCVQDYSLSGYGAWTDFTNFTIP
jgi:hypothetical protein